MFHSRRNFIQTATLSVLAGAALPALSQSATNQTFDAANLVLLDGVAQQVFEGYIGQKFSVLDGSKAMGTIKLISVTAIKPSAPSGGASGSPATSGFTLRFQGTGTPLRQGVYTLQNSVVGSMSLLLVPSGQKLAPTTYSAVFVHLV